MPTAASKDAPAVPPAGARRSHATESLVQHLRKHQGLQVVDYGGINQTNLEFVTGIGHKLYSEDLLRVFDELFPPDELTGSKVDILRMTRFLEETCSLPGGRVDAVLLWDRLQFLPEQLSEALLDQLHSLVSPGGYLLAFFHPVQAGKLPVPHSCRIWDDRHLLLQPRAARPNARGFTYRTIEKCFQRFASVRFFQTRDNLQEVVVRR